MLVPDCTIFRRPVQYTTPHTEQHASRNRTEAVVPNASTSEMWQPWLVACAASSASPRVINSRACPLSAHPAETMPHRMSTTAASMYSTSEQVPAPAAHRFPPDQLATPPLEIHNWPCEHCFLTFWGFAVSSPFRIPPPQPHRVPQSVPVSPPALVESLCCTH